MTVLLTNDDGFDAPGLTVLSEVFSSRHEVWIMAPLRNHSGASCSFSILSRLELFRKAENRYALGGTPVDCVLNAVKCGIFPRRPDAVISGINSDSNLGTDVLYSGTCGAARQASSLGIPGIALSVRRACDGSGEDYLPLAQFALENLDELTALCGPRLPDGQGGHCERFVNVNAPSRGPYRGALSATLSKRLHGGTVRVVRGSDGRSFIETVPAGEQVRSVGDGTEDSAAVEKGFVAVSVLYAEPQCYSGGGTWKDRTL